MIRLMRPSDIGSLMRLKAAAGWNQTRLDWERLLRLEPAGCFVDDRDGSPIGSTTALRHGTDLAWIGMVVVMPEFRRMGVARELMHHVLGWLARHHAGALGLDATDMGRPLYEQLGFRGEEPVERWDRLPLGTSSGGAARGPRVAPGAIEAMDLDACGYDRSALILDLAADPCVESVMRSHGFAFGRPGSSAWQLGPCIARDMDSAEPIIRDLLAPHAGRRVFWDLLPSNRPACEVARRLGFRPARRLTRMFLGTRKCPPAAAQSKRVYAIAGLEFG